MHPFWIIYPIGTRLTWEFVYVQASTMFAALLNQFAPIGALGVATPRHLMRIFSSPFSTILGTYHAGAEEESRTFKAVVLVCFIALSILLAIIWLGLVVLVMALVTLIIAVLIPLLSVWFLGLLLGFSVWFALYRVPVYDYLYPRICAWMLKRNTGIYGSLPLLSRSPNEPKIRLVRIKPGVTRQTIELELVTEDLATTAAADFEALSYLWGINLFPYTIRVNGEKFYVTHNLFEALRELRRPDRELLVWIDAVCINQHDDGEKSDQVRLMRTIYHRASRVVVWLGADSDAAATSDAFRFVQQFSDAASAEDRDRIWAAATSGRGWRSIEGVLKKILSHEWWTRAWIIQEVVAARHVLVQRGSLRVEWDKLLALFEYPLFEKLFSGQEPSISFGSDVQDLRQTLSTDSNPATSTPVTLFDLVYGFRHQFATLGSDKIFAVLGLLPPDQSSTVVPDYSKRSEDVFREFTIACLRETKTFAIVMLAPGTAVPGTSWCRDWRIPNDGFGFNTKNCFSLDDIPMSPKQYSATGASEPEIVGVDLCLGRHVLTVKGFDLGIIEKRGTYEYNPGDRPVRGWSTTLLNWERVAGGPWLPTSLLAPLSKAFNRTIVADRWPPARAGDVVDWRTEMETLDANVLPDGKSYAMALSRAALNRRFFVTQEGGFGLGPWNLKTGDHLVAILGSTVPVVLRRDCRTVDGRRNGKDSGAAAVGEPQQEFWKVIGEAYLDGVMYYNGDIAEDIRNGHVQVRDYRLP
ncbi:heterokaryon incompatibility protein-domain-containing protein [Xylariaceae sp. FL1651]|nr:heterokaryon incompatibility protein-domain-containing protein [Xylariaceae sp. FL1651]